MKKLLIIALCLIPGVAHAVDECKIMAYKLDQPIVGDVVPILGDHINTGVINQGNSESYTIPQNADMIRIVTSADVWVNISGAGDNAVVDTDEFIPSGVPFDRGSRLNPVRGQIVKCIADS